MRKKKTYLWPKRCQQHLLGLFLLSFLHCPCHPHPSHSPFLECLLTVGVGGAVMVMVVVVVHWAPRSPSIVRPWHCSGSYPGSSLPPIIVVVPSSSLSPLSHYCLVCLVIVLSVPCPCPLFPLAPLFPSHCSLFHPMSSCLWQWMGVLLWWWW